MLALDMTVTYEDGQTVDITCKTPDFLAFEAHFDKAFTVLSTDARLTYLMYLAWAAIKRTGGTKDDLEKWAENVSMVEATTPKA